MRVLLYHTKRGSYYQAADRWTNDAAAATDFISSYQAARFALEQGLEEVEVLLDFNDPEYNVYLPVKARLTNPEAATLEELKLA